MLKNKHIPILLLMIGASNAFAQQVETAYYDVNVPNGAVNVSTTVLYAQEVPYVSLGDIMRSLGGAVRVAPDQIQANYSGITAALKLNDVAVSVPGVAFTLIHPARVHNGDVYLSRADITDFFARAYQTRIAQTAPAAISRELTPITPDEPLLDEDPALLLETVALPPPEIAEAPEPAEDVSGETEAPAPADAQTATEEEQPAAITEIDQPAFANLTGVIVLDAGHGGQDGGATTKDGLVEKDYALEIAMIARRILKETTGLTILMTRDADKEVPLGVRIKTANDTKADLLISIHAGYSFTTKANGVTIFTDQSPSIPENTMTAAMRQELAARRTRGERAATFAYALAQALAADNNLGPVTVRTAPLTVQRLSELPCVLIEVTYLSNPEVVAAATEEAYREQVAQSLASAIAATMEKRSN